MVADVTVYDPGLCSRDGVTLVECPSGKLRFVSRAAANSWLRKIAKNSGANRPKHAYPCGDCDGFHVSSTDPKAHRPSLRARRRKRPR